MRRVVTTVGAPKAIGPYSQAVVWSGGGSLVFCSGQVGLDPASGDLTGAGDVRVQARRAMENLKAVLEAAGTGLNLVLKTTIFLADMGDFGAVNEVYGSFFVAEPPARSTVQVAALPRGALVEIEVIAAVLTPGS